MYIYTMGKSTIQRQKIIADLIDEGKITSQNQLKGILNKKGIPITQATLSRDLSEIGATKKRNSNNDLKYILPKDDINNAQKSISRKALKDLNFKFKYNIYDLVKEMLDSDIEKAKKL